MLSDFGIYGIKLEVKKVSLAIKVLMFKRLIVQQSEVYVLKFSCKIY
jgi:hypothetical protein